MKNEALEIAEGLQKHCLVGKPPMESIMKLATAVVELTDLFERVKLEAKIHSGEARTQRSTVQEVIQAGKPGMADWEDVPGMVKELRTRVDEQAKELKRVQRLPDQEWAAVGAILLRILAKAARDGYDVRETDAVAAIDRGLTYVNRILAQRDALVETLVKLFDWEDESYIHAILHVENAVNNLRADLAVSRLPDPGEVTFRLCYVDEQWAYFTTQDVTKQWGDDWNDAPYEHNAGTPYAYHDQTDKEPWEILKVAWDGPFRVPCDGQLNSRWTVEQINAGAAAWLTTETWADKQVAIPAGTTLKEFKHLILEGEGKVYVHAD